MSVLIKDMPMPGSCDECGLFESHAYCSGCNVASNGIPSRYNYKSNKRPDWCPLVEVRTPHGRLFDEAEVKECIEELEDSAVKWSAIALLEWAIEKQCCIEAE